MIAYKLYNTANGGSAFQKGIITTLQRVPTSYTFFQQDDPAHREFDWHAAPRNQYVLTLQGSLEFTVTDGSTFVVNPGDILIATDVEGTGHKWRMLSEESWLRAYVVLDDVNQDGFVPDRNQ
ncbi:hypothetical protein [Pedobacter nutrimenti]|uniref:hypothetical protein n=1 Tax=Pedobacter nutrimenti TaxID=1241337 RepID=UPI002931B435|nr:hypothetical protein [Pedobacter nutrimenti]